MQCNVQSLPTPLSEMNCHPHAVQHAEPSTHLTGDHIEKLGQKIFTSCSQDAVCDAGGRAPGPTLEHRIRVAAPLLGGRRLGGGCVGGRRRLVRPFRRRLVLAAAAGV